MNLLIEGNEFIGDPPAPAKTWGEYFENVFVTSLLSGLRVSALAEDRSGDTGKTSDHFADAGEMVATTRPEVTVEPVAWCIVENGRVKGLVKSKPAVMNAYLWQPLYTAPPKREPLTDEGIDLLRQGEQRLNFVTLREFRVIARAIERAHGIGGEE